MFEGQEPAVGAASTSESKADLIDGAQPPAYKESVNGSCGYDVTAYIDNEDDVEEGSSVGSEDDPWAVNNIVVKSVPWSELTVGGKVKRVLWNYTFRQICILALLYTFFISLDFMSSAFRLLAGRAAGEVFQQNEILRNPVAGLLIGMIVTVFLQSSSTTTSIIVSMVGAGLFDVKIAIPIVMGANIGTSVTNTIVSLGQSADKNQFRRAFGGATVHDMFNILSVIVFLPIEVIVGAITGKGYLELLSEQVVNSLPIPPNIQDVDLLKFITEPVSHFIVKVDKNAIIGIAISENDTMQDTLIKVICKKTVSVFNETHNATETEKCPFLFMNVAGTWPDWVIGVIMLILSLVLLCTCLVIMVKLLNSIFRGPMAYILKRFFNANLPGKAGKFFTGYIAIVIGAVMTMLVQSSSVFTSTVTPLVGLGVISLERMYPLTLGANIGTTITSMISSLAQDGDKFVPSLQISMCHLFFNISGILLWYPIPALRKVPINLAKKLGDTTAKYRWFAVLYLILAFFLMPGALFGLSFINQWVVVAVVVFLVFISLAISAINTLQTQKPQWLPKILRNWNFLPICCHSLKPLNGVIMKFVNVCSCCSRSSVEDGSTVPAIDSNPVKMIPISDTRL